MLSEILDHEGGVRITRGSRGALVVTEVQVERSQRCVSRGQTPKQVNLSSIDLLSMDLTECIEIVHREVVR